jgi:hypothetical protein
MPLPTLALDGRVARPNRLLPRAGALDGLGLLARGAALAALLSRGLGH